MRLVTRSVREMSEQPEGLPEVLDAAAVGTYPARAGAGGGYVWDAVLEYRVWCSPAARAADLSEGSDYYFPFATFGEAAAFAEATAGAEEPLALVLQREDIEEPQPGVYQHVRHERLTEWPVALLSRPRRTPRTIPDFLASESPNRLNILRGL